MKVIPARGYITLQTLKWVEGNINLMLILCSQFYFIINCGSTLLHQLSDTDRPTNKTWCFQYTHFKLYLQVHEISLWLLERGRTLKSPASTSQHTCHSWHPFHPVLSVTSRVNIGMHTISWRSCNTTEGNKIMRIIHTHTAKQCGRDPLENWPCVHINVMDATTYLKEINSKTPLSTWKYGWNTKKRKSAKKKFLGLKKTGFRSCMISLLTWSTA